MKKTLLILSIFLFSLPLLAQEEVLKQLQERYEIPNGLSTEIIVVVDVPGINIPPKEATLTYEVGKPSKIKGDGLLFFPKKGLFEEFKNILNEPHHIIPLGESEFYLRYKLVALNQKSDWITADIDVSKSDPKIEKMMLTTRKNGDFEILHSYEIGPYPVKTVINFESERFSIPLKFMGKKELIPEELEGKDVKGTITITYKNLQIH